MERVTRLVAFLLLATLFAGCARPPRWVAERVVTTNEAAALLENPDLGALEREILASEIPVVPVRERVRPCCAFGSDLHAKVGALPIPGYEIGNIIGPDDVGHHVYDAGAVKYEDSSEEELGKGEHNGLVYTCRGGFIDTAHVRDYADWMLYIASEMRRHQETGVTIVLPDEGGRRSIILEPIDREQFPMLGLTELVGSLAVWVTYQLSYWHEMATWFGWHAFPGFPETASAFSPEDLYSNMLGARLTLAVVVRRSARTEVLFNQTVDEWLEASLEVLGAVPRETGVDAAEALDGVWWNSKERLPAKDLVLRRNLGLGDEVEPWIVPAALAPESLKRDCGPDPQPLRLPNRDRIGNFHFRDYVTLQIEVDETLAVQEPFKSLGGVVTQEDFPAITELVRKQALEQYGPKGDTPDAP